METKELHRGRLIDHLQIVVDDLEKSRRFYAAVLGVLDVPITDGPDFFWADELFVSTVKSKAAAGEKTGRMHFAFQANDADTVKRAYDAGLAAGGRDNGAPGERAAYHPGYFAGFLLDPDGNNIEVVFHGAAKRSAPSVKITF